MEITDKIREKLLQLFKSENVDYRQIVSDRMRCHPNTVANVLFNRSKNTAVAISILELGKEIKEKQEEEKQKGLSIAKQL